MRRTRLPIRALLALAFPVAASAAPVVDQLFPVAFPAGSTNAVALVGKADPWPPSWWADHPGIALLPGTNAAACRIAVAPGVPPGPHWLRVFDPDGAAAPRFLVVVPAPDLAEAEPNDHFARAQPVNRLPAVVQGRLGKSGDVDSFAVSLRAGQTLVARLEAHVLMAPVDAVLRLVDTRGVERAFNHDDGRTLDPFLAWTAPADGTYVVQAYGFPHPGSSDIGFTGNDRCVYRLSLADGPWLSHTVPLVAQRGVTNTLVPAGWNLPPSPASVPVLAPAAPDARELVFRIPGAANELAVPLADEPQSVEREPNDTRADAQPVPFPGAVTGRFERRDDVDRFAFDLPASPVEFVVQSASLGFPVDVRLRVEDADGKAVARADESTPGDPSLTWTPPKAGRHFVVLDRLVQRAGDRQAYHLAVRTPRREVELSLAEPSVALEPGRTNELKVAITRRGGHTNALAFRVEGLPPGVSAAPLEVVGTAAEGTLRIVAATNAAPANVPARVVARVGGTDQPVPFPLVSGGENNGVPQGYKHLVAERLDQLWITVKPARTNAPKPGSP